MAGPITFSCTGSPLEGTSCGGEGTHWCKEGRCVPVQPTRWSGWREGVCRSGCLVHSMGYKDITRTCMVLEGYEGETCTGQDRWEKEKVCLVIHDLWRWIELCEDASICGVRSCADTRQTRTQQATAKCTDLAHFFPQINQRNPLGAPARHSDEKPAQVVWNVFYNDDRVFTIIGLCHLLQEGWWEGMV